MGWVRFGFILIVACQLIGFGFGFDSCGSASGCPEFSQNSRKFLDYKLYVWTLMNIHIFIFQPKKSKIVIRNIIIAYFSI